MARLYPAVVEAGSAGGDSSGLSSLEAGSTDLSELDAEEVGGGAGSVVLGVDVADEGWGAAEAVLGYKTIYKTVSIAYKIITKH